VHTSLLAQATRETRVHHLVTANKVIQMAKQDADSEYRFQPESDLDIERAEILAFSDTSLTIVFNQSGEKLRISVETSSR